LIEQEPGTQFPSSARVTVGVDEIDHDPVPSYSDRLRLVDRAFVVLGAGRGIGRQVAHALTQQGAKVACVDLDPERGKTVAEEVGGVALFGDVTKRDEMERLFAEARERLGPVRGLVDIVGFGHRGPLSSVDDRTWRWQFEVVVDHAFLAVQVGGTEIANAGGGAMVFVGSIAGMVTTGDNHPAYGSAKAALHHLVAYAAKELAPVSVRVNAVAPGVTLTARSRTHWSDKQVQGLNDLIPGGAPGDPSEIAGPILFSRRISRVT
jgi:NAD(P)-dependent dehydrogenase (short-subunit alcohol dehydrogenase family)